MYKLSKPQKLLYGCGVFVFAILLFGIGTITLTAKNNASNVSSSTSSSSRAANSSSSASSAIKVNCTTGSAEVQLLCYINSYRQANSLKQLTTTSGLTQVATTHSSYMASQGQLTEDGFEGATITESCQAASTVCKTQLIGFTSTGDYTQIMNDWENSSSDNKILLGDYTQIGINNHTGYLTVVLN